MNAQSNNPSLDQRFQAFLQGVQGAEHIDELHLSREQATAQRADYFLSQRSVIVEVKSVGTDMQAKATAVLEPFAKLPDWPIFYGETDISPFLETHPQGATLRRALYEAVTTALTNQFESANRQIRSTKSTFDLPNSAGLMVYLNDYSETVNPHVIAHCVSLLLCKRNRDGALRHPDIDAVLIISDTHLFVAGHRQHPFVLLVVGDNREPAAGFEETCDRLITAWAEHLGRPFAWIENRKLADLSASMVARSALDELERFPAARHEVWSREYRRNRRYERLDRSDLFRLGAELQMRFVASVLKGTRARLRPDKTAHCMEHSTYFREEMKLRGIGLEQWMSEFGERIHVGARALAGVSHGLDQPSSSLPHRSGGPEVEGNERT